MLVPDGGKGKQIAFLLSCVFFLSTLHIVFGRGFPELPDISESALEGYYDYSDAAMERRKQASASAVDTVIRNALGNEGIDADTIAVLVETDGYIMTVISAEIALKDTAYSDKARDLLSDLGIDIILKGA
jgi:hypothetical protein